MSTSVRKENRFKLNLQRANTQASDRQREIEAAFMERKERPASVKPATGVTRRQVRLWMRDNASDYDGMTQLVEAANATLRLPDGALDDESHWIWDEAFEAFECL